MISSVRNFSVHVLDADRFTIVIFQILDIKSNYLPGKVHPFWLPVDIRYIKCTLLEYKNYPLSYILYKKVL
jgi:hypothetical protein